MLKKIILIIIILILLFFSYKAINNFRQHVQRQGDQSLSLKDIGKVMKDVKGLKEQRKRNVKEYNEVEDQY
ncbi:MAG: hypothetical protein GTO02_14065 [Candidatus Dadabacteria bacterium]|nr:hypothetical protein [Candidatus Dadabacteria bacterium]NIQ15473.1 hypothetical protein [Candidatus Dadabacteria bacterium]